MTEPNTDPYFRFAGQPGVCPLCGKPLPPHSQATSRYDDQTEICSLCGAAEALEAAGVSDKEFTRVMLGIRKAELEQRRAIETIWNSINARFPNDEGEL